MSDRMPALSALRVFEVAARHLNFTHAAAELHLTHGAISHQMKSLEVALGLALFRRGRRGVELTPQGIALAAVVRDALDRIAEGLVAIRGRPANAVTVSVLPSFATQWLIPRLADFQAQWPDIDVNIRAGQALADFVREDVDLAVRYGPGQWRGLSAMKLMDEAVFPVCSPQFATQHKVRDLQDLLRVPLLHMPTQPWADWFRAVGATPPAVLRGPTFSEPGLLLRAAMDGLGVALARHALMQPELEAGRLVRLLTQSVPGEFAYYIVAPEHRPLAAPARALRDWLLAQAASAGPATPKR